MTNWTEADAEYLRRIIRRIEANDDEKRALDQEFDALAEEFGALMARLRDSRRRDDRELGDLVDAVEKNRRE